MRAPLDANLVLADPDRHGRHDRHPVAPNEPREHQHARAGPAVLAVFPRRGADGVERRHQEPIAIVHLKPDHEATEGEIRAHVASKLAAFKVPVQVIFMPDNLPRNANGKIMKKELKAQFTEAA